MFQWLCRHILCLLCTFFPQRSWCQSSARAKVCWEQKGGTTTVLLHLSQAFDVEAPGRSCCLNLCNFWLAIEFVTVDQLHVVSWKAQQTHFVEQFGLGKFAFQNRCPHDFDVPQHQTHFFHRVGLPSCGRSLPDFKAVQPFKVPLGTGPLTCALRNGPAQWAYFKNVLDASARGQCIKQRRKAPPNSPFCLCGGLLWTRTGEKKHDTLKGVYFI